MKKLSIVLACLAIPLQLGAFVQSHPPRIAYDFCAPYVGESGGWETYCEIRLYDGGSDTLSLLPGLVDPAWSPDGLRIAVSESDIVVYNLADGSRVNLTGDNDWYGPPRWSPDGARIAFSRFRPGSMELDLYVVMTDGSALTPLTESLEISGEFAWSPDSSAIAFAATVGGVRELFVMQADGSNKTRLTYNVGFDTRTVFGGAEAGASWSHDGLRIAFDCANDICVINADGTNFTRLTTDPVAAFGAVFSPVDGRIAFSTAGFGTLEVAILAEDGSVTRVAPGLRAWRHEWSPTAESLVFALASPGQFCPADGSCIEPQPNIYTVKSDGTDLTVIGQGHHPRWAPSPPGQPAATFTFSCTASACEFDGTGSSDPDGNIASYMWNFGDGTTGSGPAPAHQYATGATYRVTLSVTDQSGATGIALRDVAANAPPSAAFTVNCFGSTCTFDGSNSSDPDGTVVLYRWVFGDGSSPEFGPVLTVTHTYPTGTFTAWLSITDNGGGFAQATATLTIVNALPVASFTVACTALTCTVDASASSDADSPIYHTWQFGDGAQAVGRVASHTYSAGGTYAITLTVTDDVRQTATAVRTVTVIAPPPPEMHVGDLDSSRAVLQKTWNAYATVEIHREDHQGVESVTVSGRWNDGTAATCTTDTAGRCVLARNGIPNKSGAVTLTVVGAIHATRVYKPAVNHDTDGGSIGTSITVLKR